MFLIGFVSILNRDNKFKQDKLWIVSYLRMYVRQPCRLRHINIQIIWYFIKVKMFLLTKHSYFD